MQPLKITATLQSPVAGDFSLPLDGILHYMAHRDRLGPLTAALPGSNTGIQGVQLPLKRIRVVENGRRLREWFYAASWAQWPKESANNTDYWNCRFDFQQESLIDFGGRKARIDTSSGPYKSYHMPIFARHAVSLTWYAVGDPVEIRRLLSHCTHVGKKPSQGWGSINSWTVESVNEDYSVRGPGGQPMRAIPHPSGILAGYRPSYWLSANQRPCIIPLA